MKIYLLARSPFLRLTISMSGCHRNITLHRKTYVSKNRLTWILLLFNRVSKFENWATTKKEVQSSCFMSWFNTKSVWYKKGFI